MIGSRSEAILRILEGRPRGAVLWMRVHGRSMYPLLWSGQFVRIVRCGPDDVLPGDFAVGRRPDGVLIAHVVASTDPVRLSTSFGRLDPIGTEVLGRADAMRTRGGCVIPLPRYIRRVVLPVQSALGAAVQDPCFVGAQVRFASGRLPLRPASVLGSVRPCA